MMDKLISQQAAIEAVVGCTNCGTEDVLRAYVTKHSLENVWTGGIVDALDAIEQLPSAHPDLDEWCTDCKEYDSDKHCCPRFSRVIREALKEAQPETAKRIVGKSRDGMTLWYQCDMCNEPVDAQDNYCRGCGRRLIDG